MRRDFIISVALVAVVGLGACSAKPGYRRIDTSGSGVSSEPLGTNKAVFVSVPGDAVRRNKVYTGSGQEVAQSTATAFSRYATRVEIASPDLEEREQLLAAARRASAGYLIVLTIVHWEPRATAWSGIPSQVDIGLSVINADTGREVRSTVLEGRSPKMDLARNSPEALYTDVLDGLVGELYGAKTAAGHP